jgi:hypothetical protein
VLEGESWVLSIDNNNINTANSPTMTEEKKKQRWFPLESNPTLINNYINDLGFDTSLYEVRAQTEVLGR